MRTGREQPVSPEPGARTVRTTATDVRGVEIYRFPWIKEERGDLTFAELDETLPFRPQRYFMIFGTPAGAVRGEHAHKSCHQLLICARGSCVIAVDDGRSRREFTLNHPTVGIHVAPMVWVAHSQHSADAVLLVLASERYDPADYIREYHDFRTQLGSNPAP